MKWSGYGVVRQQRRITEEPSSKVLWKALSFLRDLCSCFQGALISCPSCMSLMLAIPSPWAKQCFQGAAHSFLLHFK